MICLLGSQTPATDRVVTCCHGIGKVTFQHVAKTIIGPGTVNVVHDIEGITGQKAESE